jgi:hypothetical protein
MARQYFACVGSKQLHAMRATFTSGSHCDTAAEAKDAAQRALGGPEDGDDVPLLAA